VLLRDRALQLLKSQKIERLLLEAFELGHVNQTWRKLAWIQAFHKGTIVCALEEVENTTDRGLQ